MGEARPQFLILKHNCEWLIPFPPPSFQSKSFVLSLPVLPPTNPTHPTSLFWPCICSWQGCGSPWSCCPPASPWTGCRMASPLHSRLWKGPAWPGTTRSGCRQRPGLPTGSRWSSGARLGSSSGMGERWGRMRRTRYGWTRLSISSWGLGETLLAPWGVSWPAPCPPVLTLLRNLGTPLSRTALVVILTPPEYCQFPLLQTSLQNQSPVLHQTPEPDQSVPSHLPVSSSRPISS